MAQWLLACLAPAGGAASADAGQGANLISNFSIDDETSATSLMKCSRPADVLVKDSRDQMSRQGPKKRRSHLRRTTLT
jgi:hypothetical protein